jgi:hypothetical protein
MAIDQVDGIVGVLRPGARTSARTEARRWAQAVGLAWSGGLPVLYAVAIAALRVVAPLPSAIKAVGSRVPIVA